MRAAEVSFIRDCAEMAARASLFREESRWGLYHYRADFPQKNNLDWFCHAHLKKDEHGNMVSFKSQSSLMWFRLIKMKLCRMTVYAFKKMLL